MAAPRHDIGWRLRFIMTLAASLLLVGCGRETQSDAPEVRPVRTIMAEKREHGESVAFTGRIEAANESRLAFRIGGRMIERPANMGDRVEADQVVAKLDPQDELNALRAAQASVSAARAQRNEANSEYERQSFLLARNVASRAQFERAEQALETARARLDTAEAQLRTAEDQVTRTELRADAPGVVTAVPIEPGEVVQAGQMIVRIARQDGRDAVFDVPGQILRSAPNDPLISVNLTNDPAVKATGRVREISPQADPVTRTFEVKVGLTEPPQAMLLGSTVVGRMQLDTSPTIEIPASALTEFDRRPAVWIVDPKNLTVSPRNVEVLRHNPATVTIATGIEPGDIVVTAGTQALHPGQKTRLLGPAG